MASLFDIFNGPNEKPLDQQKLAEAQAELQAATAIASNTTLPPEARLAGVGRAKAAQQLIDANLVTKTAHADSVQATNTNKALTDAGFAPAVAAGPKPSDPISFGAPAASSASSPSTPWDIVKTLLPGATITSTTRTPEHNAAVGGVSNSLHLSGRATDFTLPAGVDHKTAIAALKAAGFDEVLDEGNHIHAGFEHNPIGMAQPTVGPGATQVPVGFVDPAFAMGMVPQAHLVGHVQLPNAPQREMPGALPAYQGIDKASEMAALTAAFTPKPRDGSHDAWDRVAALLQGAAQGGAQVNPHTQGIGQFLLAAGGGAAGGFRTERKTQQADIDASEEQARQAKMALAKLGFDIDQTNLGTSNTNLDRNWKSGENVKDTKYSNANANFENATKQLLTNLGIDQNNAGAMNSRDMSRTQVGLSALEQATEAGNKANAYAAGGGPGGMNPQGQQDRAIDSMLAKVGYDAANTRDPKSATARQTAAAIHANNVDGALQSLSQELVENGGAEKVLAPQKGEAPEVAAAKQKALQGLRGAKKPGDPGAQLAAQTVAQLLGGNHAVALQIAKDFAKAGYPSAKLIVTYAGGQ